MRGGITSAGWTCGGGSRTACTGRGAACAAPGAVGRTAVVRTGVAAARNGGARPGRFVGGAARKPVTSTIPNVLSEPAPECAPVLSPHQFDWAFTVSNAETTAKLLLPVKLLSWRTWTTGAGLPPLTTTPVSLPLMLLWVIVSRPLLRRETAAPLEPETPFESTRIETAAFAVTTIPSTAVRIVLRRNTLPFTDCWS